ncbi:hypothetical protein FQA39_LY06952 [Lamprigera yunnana]|nr:hypothetical protein FQA39_LY06952 [Lamprigera yunnana]
MIKMDLKEELITSFKIYANISDKVLRKCEEMCSMYNLSPEDLADQWGAYSISHLKNAIPTFEGLQSMERKEFKNYSALKSQGTPSYKKAEEVPEGLDLNTPTTSGLYTPKSTQSTLKRPRRPEELQESMESTLISTPTVHDFTQRTNSGEIVLSYGVKNLLSKATFQRIGNTDQMVINISSEIENLSCDARYMYNVMTMKASSLNAIVEIVGKYLLNKFGLGEPEGFNKASGLVTTYGRICPKTNVKLHVTSVLLEGSQDLTRGNTIELNLNKVSNYALFPGQIVAIEGLNPSGTNFIVQKIYTDAAITETIGSSLTITSPLQLMVAAGPFTLANDISYQPLQDLIKTVAISKPHVLILIGPFLDASQDNICDITITDLYSDFFEKLLECVMSPLESLDIKVVLIPSSKDAHLHVVYPTPPYKIKKRYTNLHCFADPCLININGCIIAATSTDIISHLGSQEFCSGLSGDRLGRLASHILCQQSFYPLYPPEENMCIDYELLEQYGQLNIAPHLLILPSKLQFFIKCINRSIVINPGKCTKGFVGGTFCKVEVSPTSEAAIPNNIVAQIVRI